MTSTSRPIVIAHRGASGYLPEHTLAGKALAFAMGADYLEQDVVATADDELIVLHDVHLDDVTDVAAVFAKRHRDDGRYYARDFTLAEIRRLRVTERRAADGGTARYPGRFPIDAGAFSVPTLADELAFIQGLSASTGRPVGIYPEIKRPAWHRGEGIELGDALLDCLERHGYDRPESRCFVQCFDFAETERLRRHCGTRLPLIQLVGENDWRESDTDYDWLRSDDGLAAVAAVANGIGPWLIPLLPASRVDRRSDLVARAQAIGLAVHPFTLRADDLPDGFSDFEALLRTCLSRVRADGYFTDFPDRLAAAIERHDFGDPQYRADGPVLRTE